MTAVYDAWCGLKEVHAGLISRVAARYDVSPDRLLQSSLLCVALHDVGKLSRNFQDMMRAASEAAYKAAVGRNYRHEVAALWLVDQAARHLNVRFGAIPGGGLLEVLAVAGHHKFLADGYLFDEQRFLQTLTWEPDPWSAVKAACCLARAMFEQQGWDFPLKKLGRGDVERNLTTDSIQGRNTPFGLLLRCSDDLSKRADAYQAGLRDLFLLLKGLLMTADWMASGAVGREDDLNATKGIVRVKPRLLENHLRDRIERRRLERPTLELQPFAGYTPFQTTCAATDGHVIAVAPTGSGKTEASWLWALNQIERGHARKIFILLPTMVTANSIHDRLRAFFSEHGHKVGLVHSTADLVQGTHTDGDDESDRADVRSDHLSETHFFRPVTVGTIDQLLVPLFHAGRWAMKTMAAAEAAIVIDEVHAYEFHTLGLITLMIEQLNALGARFMIMSATMPESLRTSLRKALDSTKTPVSLVNEDTLLNSARNAWETCDTPLSHWIRDDLDNGLCRISAAFLDLWKRRNDRGEPLRILIVVNTVKRCQDLAVALHRDFGSELICYHSKFIFDHRREKEQRINECPPRLLIATQVVEVSLEIDYDVLLTECAPIDALVQRAGRVNRARRPNLGRVVVHPSEEGSETIYGSLRGILDTSWELCRAIEAPPTEHGLIAMVEKVYQGHVPEESDDFKKVRAAALTAQDRLCGVLDAPHPAEEDALLKTRKDEYPQVSVIPEAFAEEARAAHPRDRKRFELKVPVWYARKHKVATDELAICPMSYSDEYGAVLVATIDYPEPGHTIF